MTDRASKENENSVTTIDGLRLSRGWTVAELAERSQLELGELESILRDEGQAPLDVIILLARAFGLTPGELVDRTAEDRD